MGQETRLSQLSKVALDTSPFIYLVEDAKVNGVGERRLFSGSSSVSKVTSIITPLEILSYCHATKQPDLCWTYEQYLRYSGEVEVQTADWMICDQAIQLRAMYGLKVPDALQAATAICLGAECMITNDRHLLRVKELKVVLFDELEL